MTSFVRQMNTLLTLAPNAEQHTSKNYSYLDNVVSLLLHEREKIVNTHWVDLVYLYLFRRLHSL